MSFAEQIDGIRSRGKTRKHASSVPVRRSPPEGLPTPRRGFIAIPTIISRSDLIVPMGARSSVQHIWADQPVYSDAGRGIRLRRTGPYLCEDDATILGLLCGLPPVDGDLLQRAFVPAHLLRELQWSDSRERYQELRSSIKRLGTTSIEVLRRELDERGDGLFALVSEARFSGICYSVWLPRQLPDLSWMGYTQLELRVRTARISQVALYLHRKLRERDHQYQLLQLRELRVRAGYGSPERHWRAAIGRALDELRDQGVVAGWGYEDRWTAWVEVRK